MANNGYRQQNPPWGPPPQQRYPDQYNQRPQQERPPQNRMYSSEADAYNGYQNGTSYQHNGFQGQDNYNEQWNEQYSQRQQQPIQQDYRVAGRQSEQQYVQHEPHNRQQQDRGYSRQNNYQYDERYRTNGQPRPPPQHTQSHGPPSSQGNGGRHMPADMRNARVPQRILKKEESPVSVAWDNPFGAFPTKKKQSEMREQERSDSRSDKVKSPEIGAAAPEGRPLTSHGTRPGSEPRRPHTSHDQRQQMPLSGRTQVHDKAQIPNRNFGIQSRDGYFEEPGTNNLPGRPEPRRAMTGPSPQEQLYDQHPPPQQQRPLGDSQRVAAMHQQIPNGQFRERQQFQHSQPQLMHSNQNPVAVTRPNQQFDANTYEAQNRTERNDRYTQPHQLQEDFDSSSYRGIPSNKKPSIDMPNFDVMVPNASQRYEDQLIRSPPSQPDSVYRRAVYQENKPLSPISIDQRSYRNDDVNELVSPMSQFSFNGTAQTSQHVPLQPAHQPRIEYDRERNENQQYGRPQRQPPLNHEVYAQNSTVNSQFPPRSASRADGQPSLGPIPGQPIRRPTFEQEPLPNNGRAYGAAGNNVSYDQHQNQPVYQEAPPISKPAQPLSDQDRERQRSGYDPRLQPRANSLTSQQYQQPPQPPTSNSNPHPGVNGQNGRISAETFRSNMTGRSNPDSLPSHPAPFRPGLMQPTPPPPVPVQAISPPVQQQSPAPVRTVEPQPAPVTVQELNKLREAFKANPNDHKLGLNFAKRLVEASRVLANENGKADPKQTAKNRERYVLDAHKVVKRLIHAGYPEAMFYMADCYGQGLLGLQPDPKEAFSLYQSAAKLNHAQAAYRVAVCCELGAEDGGGTRRDPLKAVQWYKRAATLGDTPAMYKMGMIQLKGLLGQPRNPREAITWLKRAAERADAENPHAVHELALLYENPQPPDIVVRDEKYALQLFIQSAELGYKYSQFRLGSAYEYGLLGCPVDARLSIAWYSRAAAQGEHQSEFALSGWYLTGSGQPPPGERPLLEQNDTEAFLWARKAATSGLTKAEYAMGYYTEVGIGVTANMEEAKKWYFRAAAQNHPKARERLEDLKRGGARMQKTRVSRSNVSKQNEGECSVM